MNLFSTLPWEVRYHIFEFADTTGSALERYQKSGPLTYANNRRMGFPRGQSPTILGLPQLRSKPIWTAEVQGYLDIIGRHIEEVTEEYRRCTIFDTLSTGSIGQNKNDGHASDGHRDFWQVCYLMEEGYWDLNTTLQCPKTLNVLKQLPIFENAMGYVYFSVLGPGAVIHPHFGVTNAKIRIQFPLFTKKRGEDDLTHPLDATLKVSGEKVHYCHGEGIAFDDSYIHSVINRSQHKRVVLLVDIWHPDICEEDRKKIDDLFGEGRQSLKTDHDCLATTQIDGVTRDYDYLFKLLSIGDCGVGKTSFTMRFGEDVYYEDRYIATIGVDFKIKHQSHKGKVCKLLLWDTAGPERFRTITSSYYRGCHGLFIMFDLTDRSSFENVNTWITSAKIHVPPGCIIFMVGSKQDLTDKRAIRTEEALAKAKEHGVLYFEISSKRGKGIGAMMRAYLSKRMGSIATLPPSAANPAGKAPAPDEKKKTKRCVIQ